MQIFNTNLDTYYVINSTGIFLGGHVIATSVGFYMVSLAQHCVGTGEALVLAHTYFVTVVLYIII